MTGSDNVCYANENKGLSGYENRIKVQILQAVCGGESSVSSAHSLLLSHPHTVPHTSTVLQSGIRTGR